MLYMYVYNIIYICCITTEHWSGALQNMQVMSHKFKKRVNVANMCIYEVLKRTYLFKNMVCSKQDKESPSG